MAAQATMGITIDRTAQARFRDLLDAHRGIVLKVASTYARSPEDRADLAQEIVAQCWRAFAKHDPARAFSTWLYRIALNVAVSHRRSGEYRERHTVALDEALHDIGGDDGERDERVTALYRVIDSFDPLNRALLLLYLDERGQREIADILGLSETNVATKLGRLRQRLRKRLADHA
ncbi:MAG: sigma-70 family RNA polymerase sigma factor [Rudaea sp.]|uniref:RNA polymerase sigma factor n=1 Tax=Rudaea sp. TaxID=2136325 RepID=UPI0039E2A90C